MDYGVVTIIQQNGAACGCVTTVRNTLWLIS